MIIVFWTSATLEEARNISRELVEKKLVACANLIPSIESIYEWQGKVETTEEVKVLLKTAEKNFQQIQTFIQEKCSYDVPEITYVKVDGGNEAYLSWVQTFS